MLKVCLLWCSGGESGVVENVGWWREWGVGEFEVMARLGRVGWWRECVVERVGWWIDLVGGEIGFGTSR